MTKPDIVKRETFQIQNSESRSRTRTSQRGEQMIEN